jgi:hypothetical protein
MRFASAIVCAAALAGALAFAAAPASACNDRGSCDGAPGRTHGAPGPIAGAGLPFLAVGYGVYWLIKRRRKADLDRERA